MLIRVVVAALHALQQDVPYVLRSLRRAPGFSLTVIATLALCIGANATVFSALNDLVLEPRPFEDADRLVQLFNLRQDRSPDNPFSESSWNQYVDLKSRTGWIEDAALRAPTTVLVGREGIVQRLTGQSATADLFDLVGARPVLGRFFGPAEVDPGPGHVVVLSQTWWESEFDGDPTVLGDQLVFGDGVAYAIIGVAPRIMEALDHQARFTVPLPVDARDRDPGRGRYQAHSHDLWLRLRPGVDREVALERISAIERDWFERTADADGRRVFEDYDGRVEFDLPHPLKGSLYLLEGAALLIFLTGCSNVTILFLIRVLRRRRELSIRRALGAGKSDLRRLMLVEIVLLAGSAGTLGVAIAWKGASVINEYLGALNPYTPPIALDGAVLVSTVVLSLGIVGAAGLIPLGLLRRSGPAGGIDGSLPVATRSPSSARVGDAMVGGQVAIAFMLLIGAGLLLQSLRNVLAVDPGFAANRVVEGRLDFTTVRTFYPSREDAGRLKRRIVDAMSELPGVEGVALSMFPMLSHDLRAGGRNFMSGGTAAPEAHAPSINYVSPGFFATMGIPIRAGRACGPEDTAQSVVVDELLAERAFGDANPVGLEIPRQDDRQPVERVIGVSGRANLRGPEQRDLQPFYYRCEPVEAGWWEYSILLRTSRGVAGVIRDMERRLREVDPRLPLSYSSSLKKAMDDTVLVRKAITVLQAAFAASALLLSLVGVFAVLASSVVERRREIGVRLAVGARRGDVYRLVLAKGLSTTSIGLGFGILGAATLSGLLEGFLFDVHASDPGTYLKAIGLFIAAALLACLVPARQAAGIDPLESIRSQ